MPKKFIESVVTLEVTCHTQLGYAEELVRGRLQVPAITKVKVTSVEVVHKSKPKRERL